MWMKVAFFNLPLSWWVLYVKGSLSLKSLQVNKTHLHMRISREGFRQKKSLQHLSGHAGDSSTQGCPDWLYKCSWERGNMNQEVQTEWCVKRAEYNIASEPLWIFFFGEFTMEARNVWIVTGGGWHARKLPEKDKQPGGNPERGQTFKALVAIFLCWSNM